MQLHFLRCVLAVHFLHPHTGKPPPLSLQCNSVRTQSCISCTPSVRRSSGLHFLHCILAMQFSDGLELHSLHCILAMRFRAAFPALHPGSAIQCGSQSCISCPSPNAAQLIVAFPALRPCSAMQRGSQSCIFLHPVRMQRSSQLHFLQPFPCSAWVRAAFSCTPSLQRGCRGWVRSAAPATLSMQCRGRPASPALRPCSAAASQLRSASPAPHPCSVGSDLHLLQCCPCSAGSSLQRGCVAAQLRALLHPILAAWGQICISCNAVHAVLGQICISCTPPLHSGVRSASPATLSMHRSSDLHLLHPISAFWGQICISCSAVHAVLGRPRSMGASQLRSASPAPHPCNVGSDLHLLQCGPCSAGADLHLLHPISAFWGQTSISCNAVHALQLRSASPAPHLCILGSDQHLL